LFLPLPLLPLLLPPLAVAGPDDDEGEEETEAAAPTLLLLVALLGWWWRAGRAAGAGVSALVRAPPLALGPGAIDLEHRGWVSEIGEPLGLFLFCFRRLLIIDERPSS